MKKEILRKFLFENKMFIDYNSEFRLFDRNKNVLLETNNQNDIFYFVLGWNSATAKAKDEIDNLIEANEILNNQNETNIKNYEGIITSIHNQSSD